MWNAYCDESGSAFRGVDIDMLDAGRSCLAPVSVAFFAAAPGMVVFRAAQLAAVYKSVEGPILVMLENGAMDTA